jgi:cytochrome c oxidase accessory protein FixG
MANLTVLQPDAPVLSTLNRDGTRRWLKPRVSRGAFLRARQVVAYGLILVFTLVPFLKIGGRPVLLLDVVRREFSFLGVTFLPTDTILLALLMLAVFVGVFLVTALLGRAWCGWACPQTVYMEFVYRPIERLVEGTLGRGGRRAAAATAPRAILKALLYFVVSFYLANTFLAYFVPVEELLEWVRRSPFEHPGSFGLVLVTTGAMLFNFAYFREQTCVLACPYGRFQSVLLDRNSLIISYDPARGEPRAKGRRAKRAERIEEPDRSPALRSGPGDCVDCGLCVVTCPTGIDIRDGLQMECVACAQCIDACDDVMRRVGLPTGLIRYTSHGALAGKPARILRPRVLIYGAILAVLITAMLLAARGAAEPEVKVLRGPGLPFTRMPDGLIANNLRLRIQNRTDQTLRFSVDAVDAPAGTRLDFDAERLEVAAGRAREEPLLIRIPPEALHGGRCDVQLRISAGERFSRTISYRLLGPEGR